VVGEPADPLRGGHPDGDAQDVAAELGQAAELRAATGDDEPGGQAVGAGVVGDLLPDLLEDLAHARLDDLGDVRPAGRSCHAIVDDLDGRLGHVRGARVRGAEAHLQLLRRGQVGAQADGDVVGDVDATEGHDAGIEGRAVGVERDVGRARPDVGRGHAQLPLRLREDGLARGDG
jgi:hypothetical protein